MGEKKGKVCYCIVFAGIIVIAVGLLADVIGLGKDPGFGPQQTLFTAAGVAILLLGILFGPKICRCGKTEEASDQGAGPGIEEEPS